MATIRFVENDGTEHSVNFTAGASLMQTAVDNGIPGIDADCGGSCACGTCHVFLSEEWLPKLPPPAADEEQLLSMTPERSQTSRLACQIRTSPEMDGMVVRLPEFQM